MKIAAIYCRVSQKTQNIDQQKETLINYCKTNSWAYRSYLENGVSGKIIDRPQWSKLIKDCERGLFDTIIVQSLDRITRNAIYGHTFSSWCIKNKINLICLFEPVDLTTDSGWLAFNINILISEYRLRLDAYKRNIGIARAKAKGVRFGRPPKL